MSTVNKLRKLIAESNLTHIYKVERMAFHRGGRKTYYAFDMSDNLGKTESRTLLIAYKASEAIGNLKEMIRDRRVK